FVTFATLTTNIFEFYMKNFSDYLYIFDLAYVVYNSASFIALSISPSGLDIKDEIARAVSIADHVAEPMKIVILDHMNRVLDSSEIERAHYSLLRSAI
ncbi:MAG: hypothetical protein QXN26_06545, partial [Thermoplasmataceae archaeon]